MSYDPSRPHHQSHVSKSVSKYLFVNEKNYNGITEVKYIIYQIGLVKRLRVFVVFWILTKIKKKHFFCWQDDIIHTSKCMYLHCAPSSKIPLKLKSIGESEDS